MHLKIITNKKKSFKYKNESEPTHLAILLILPLLLAHLVLKSYISTFYL